MKLTQKLVQAYFDYNRETGLFTWKLSRGRKIKAGISAGVLDARGYITIGFFKHKITAHRLAFLYVEGKLPEEHVDHINHIKHDNRWCNLQKVSKQENELNRGKQSNNTSGYTGVTWHRQTGKWRATLQVDGRQKSLGLFLTKEEAAKVINDFKVKAGYHYNHGFTIDEVKSNE